MNGFRLTILIMWLALVGYTGVVIARDGMDLLPVFFGAMAEGRWPGQFNADFTTFLTLSGIWTAWRGGFTPASIALGIFAFFMGGGFLLAYLLYLSWRCEGDLPRMLLGIHHRPGA